MTIFVNSISNLDLQAFRWLNSWVDFSDFIDWTIVFRAQYLGYVVFFALLVFLGVTATARFCEYRKKNLEMVFFALMSGLIARFGATELIRFFYDRPRPFEVLDEINQLLNHSNGGSFPSGHAAFFFAVAAAVSFYYPKTSILFFIAAVNIGLARVAAGVHWPSDILGGAIVGIVTAFIIHRAKIFIEKRQPWAVR